MYDLWGIRVSKNVGFCSLNFGESNMGIFIIFLEGKFEFRVYLGSFLELK